MATQSDRETEEILEGCGGCCISLFIKPILGGYAINYCLHVLFGTSIHWFLAGLFGFFIAQFVVPIALVLWIIVLSGVPIPFIHQ